MKNFSQCRYLIFCLVWILVLPVSACFAQITADTYRKAEYFLSGNIVKQVYHLEVVPNWLPDNSGFWHVAEAKEGKRFYLTVIEQQSTREAFDHHLLASKLKEASGKEVDAAALSFDRISFPGSGKVGFQWNNLQWEFDTLSSDLKSEKIAKREDRQGISPDGKWRAFTQDFNLYIENLESGEQAKLSSHGKQGFEYGSYYGWGDIIMGENGARPDRFMVRWSPDSKKILTQIVDLRLAEKMYMLDFAEQEKFRPTLLSYFRGSPGDTTVVTYIPVIFDVSTKKETVLSALTSPHFIGVDMLWESDSQRLRGVHTYRGYKQIDIFEVEAESGKIKTIYAEKTDTYLNRDIFLYQKLSNGQFLISSQRSGWNQLYLYDWASGKLIRQLTSGSYFVNRIVHVDESAGWLYFTATGKEKGRSLYYPHLYKVKLDGTGIALLTQEDAFHEISLSPDKKYFVDNYSTVSQPTISVLRELESGRIVSEISRADHSNLLGIGYQSPRQFSATAKDGTTEIHGIYFVPTDFDANKSYPIIDYTYTGPHIAITPKTFKGAIIGLQQSFAELGFIVVTVDGLGTAGRSKAFADVSYRNLGDGTTDHVLAIKQLAASQKFMDIDKVGIFGHSAGGYDAARAMLLHPEFYKVGVASAGDHDHRMEKAWWPEMYMGYPVGEFYHQQSNITNAANLKGRLLLAHGAVDENVNASATYKFAEALIAAGKDFDMFIWPSRNHNFGRTNGDYFTKKRWDYFIKHLLGQEPLLHYQIGH